MRNLTFLAITSIAVALIGCLLGGVFTIMMIVAINRKSAVGEQIPYLGFGPFKGFRVISEYRRLYPSGRLHLLVIASVSVMLGGAAGVALSLGLMSLLSPGAHSR